MQEGTATSPRSTILDILSAEEKLRSGTMASSGGTEVAKAGREKATDTGAGAGEKVSTTANTLQHSGPESSQKTVSVTATGQHVNPQGTVSPSQSNIADPGYPHLTPQQTYHIGYQSQVTPEPPSPAGPTVYEAVGSFFHQPTAFPIQGTQYVSNHTALQQTPGSPSQSNSVTGIPPPSPLFPRVSGQVSTSLLDTANPQRVAPLSPGPPYLASQQVGAVAMYPNMHMYPSHNGSDSNSMSGDEYSSSWGDNRGNQSGYAQNSPQISGQGIPIPYIAGGIPPRPNRSYSFEETTMLPPAAMPDPSSQQAQSQSQGHQDFGNLAYSPYSSSVHTMPGNPGAGFTHQTGWGYSGPPPEAYNANGGPLQARSSSLGFPGGPPRHLPQQAVPYGGHFFPTSPGPPIQTTSSNKGPDGANLFIFHIPNHFTNLDMYQLFAPFGNLLSVRIMVEKDTGRSRGFGFVSYDSPDAAASAIKELNGFAIGNKRLKVQHKQIRSSEQQYTRNHGSESAAFDLGTGYGRAMPQNSLPTSDPISTPDGEWYHGQRGQDDSQPHDDAGMLEEVRQQSQEEGRGGMESTVESSSSMPDDVAGETSTETLDLEPLRQTLPEVNGSS